MPDTAAAYKNYLPEADVAAIVEDRRSILRIVQHARLIHDDARLSWDEARAYYRRGHTLLLRYAERSSPKLRALADDFANFFHAPVDIQLYLTPERAQAFGWHVARLKLFDFLTQRLSHLPFWCERLALAHGNEAGDTAAVTEGDQRIWQDRQQRLHDFLAREETFTEFMAYLVDAKRAKR